MAEELKDLKPESAPDGNSQAEQTAEELKQQLAEQKAELDRIKSDNENYKQAIISKNAKNFRLGHEEEKPQQPQQVIVHPPVEETDDEKAWKRVQKEAEKVYEDKYVQRTKAEERQNEQIAIKKFFKSNPIIATNEAMKQGVREYYVNRNGKSVEGITMDMEEALEYWAYKNNVVLKPENRPTNANIANMGGNGGEVRKPAESGFIAEIVKYVPQLAGKPELLKQYKEKVLNGEIQVPENVRALLNNV